MVVTISAASPFNPWNRAWRAYERSLRRRPILTQAVSSALLWGLGDGMAQRIEKGGRPGVDGRRVALTAAFGGSVIGPAGHCWYQLLEALVLRMGLACSTKSMLFKVAVDNLIYSPCYVFAFFAFGCLAIDGLSAQAFGAKVRSEFLPTMLAEALVWPPYMAYVFARVPVQHQLLAVNVATLFDVCFLSWSRTRAGEAQAQTQPGDARKAQARQQQQQRKERGAKTQWEARRRWRRQVRERRRGEQAAGGSGDGAAAAAGSQEEGQGSVGGDKRQEFPACLWEPSPEPSLARRALMAASATCSSAGSGGGGGIFW